LKKYSFTLLISFICALYGISVEASSPAEDSLELKIGTSTGFEKIDLLLTLSESYLNQNPKKAIEISKSALELAVKANDPMRQASANYLIGDGYRQTGENVKAFDYFAKAEKLFKELYNREGIAKSVNSLGRICRVLGNYPEALEYQLNALHYYEELADKNGIASSLVNTGIIYRNLGKKEIALEYYLRALDICNQTGDLVNQVNALVSIGNVYWYDNDNAMALSYYVKALTVSQKPEYKGEHPGGILNNIGNVNRSLGKLDAAIDYYKQALTISTEIGDRNQIAITLKNIGIAYKESGKLSEAIQSLMQSKSLAVEIHIVKIQRETLEQLSQTYTLLADYKKALEYYLESSKLKDSLFDEETTNKISLLQLSHNIREQESQETINEKDVELRFTKERNIRNVIIFVTLLALSFVIILWNRYRLNMRKNEELVILNSNLERRVEERTKRLREENEQRRFAQEQAELANETKNRFLATISHEVRTPINAIIGFCDLAIKTDVDNDHQKNLKRVKDSSEHLLALIKDILDYSQIESGRMELKPSSFDLYKLITSVINAYYLDASSKDIKLSFEIGKDIPRYLINDPEALRQVLYNLIGNAIKFTDKGTVELLVRLEAGSVELGEVKLGFSIKDSGIGISKLKQKLIFMDFTQVDNTATRKYGGVGLGLTISKYFVELMGGKISVHSDKGHGSEFRFDILLKVDKDKLSNETKKPTGTTKKLHLLVAEDNLLNSQVITVFLNRLGHSVKVASNGKIAVEILAMEDFDAVLMDIEMPEMDGIEATQAIRNGNDNVRNPKIPIIALTAHALKAYEEKCYEAGMNSYLTKPVDIEKLSAVLQTV
jgi:signal transduction histidine kinase/ActR/RegA family two-component response regulator